MFKAQLRSVALAVLVLVLITAGTAAAASPGSPFRLGVLNTVQRLTRLTGSTASPMLRITNNGVGTALQLITRAGTPPMSVNSSTKVTNLNADKLDGLDSTAFLGVGAKAADSDRLDGLDSTAFLGVGAKAADSDLLDGLNSTRFMGATVTKREAAAPAIGTSLGDGTAYIDQACAAGEILLSGGPANVNSSSVMVESFPTPGSTNSWRARINSTVDAFSVVVLCASR